MNIPPLHRSLLFLVLTVHAVLCQAPRYTFKNITVEQGLSQNSVFAIAQDRQGFIWFGTKDGLNRYDGYSFITFRNIPSDSMSLSDNFITNIFFDHRGQLWIGTQNGGVHLFDRFHETFRRLAVFERSGMGTGLSQINSIAEDDEGSVWAATSGGGLVRMRSMKDGSVATEVFTHDPADPSSLADDRVNCIYNDSRGTMWVSSGNHVQTFLSTSAAPIFIERSIPVSSSAAPLGVLCFFTDSRSRLWLGSRLGLFRYDRAADRYIFFRIPAPEDPEADLLIRTIAEGEHGSLWIGTFNNMMLFDPERGTYSFHFANTNINVSSGVIRIFRDIEGTMWCCTNGRGIFSFNPFAGRFHSMTERTMPVPGWDKRSVRSLLIDSEGKIWVGSYGGLYISDRTRTSFHRVFADETIPVRGMIEDRRRTVWLATQSGVIHSDIHGNTIREYRNDPDDPSSIPSTSIAAVFEDRERRIWIVTPNALSRLTDDGTWHHEAFASPVKDPNDIIPSAVHQDDHGDIWFTSENGLWRFEPNTGQFFHVTSTGPPGKALNYNVTLSLCPDPLKPAKYLWIGTAGGGLNRLDIGTGIVTPITSANGLPNDVINGIESDSSGDLWLSTNKGIARFEPTTGHIRTYGFSDGLQGDEYNAGAFCRGPNGEIVFGGIMGFDAFIPHRVRDNPYDPDIVITGMQLFNRPVEIGDATGILSQSMVETDHITLAYDQNVVSFTFASLDYTVPDKNRYRYRLVGFDDRFNESGTHRTATYTNLDPGEYHLRVQGSNSDGIWGTKEATLTITVLPPIWMTWWFRGVFVAILLLAGPIIYFRRVSALTQEKKQQEEFSRKLIASQEHERKRIAAEIHDSLGQNLLVMKNRALLALEKSGLPEDVREDLSEISSTASGTLKEMRELSRNLRPYELDRFGITEALTSVVEKMGDASTIAFRSDIAMIDGLLTKEAEINLYRIVQECLNNIVKHSGAVSASVAIAGSPGMLQVTIRDDGEGFDPIMTAGGEIASRGLGLESTAERVRILNGTLTIDSSPGGGTTVSISIPIARTVSASSEGHRQ